MPADQNQSRSLLASLIRGGALGNNSPYANEAMGPFATSPRIYGANPMATSPVSAAGVPIPQPRPDQPDYRLANAVMPRRAPVPQQRPSTYSIGAAGNMPNVPNPQQVATNRPVQTSMLDLTSNPAWWLA